MEQQVEKLLRMYDSGTGDVQRQAVVQQLDAIRAKAASMSHMSGYPSVGGPDFACRIAANLEFAKNAVPTTSAPSCGDTFQLSHNQVFIRNFFKHYDSLLLFHGVGVGKTCTSITVAESLMDQFKRRPLVLVPPKLKSNFVRQVFDSDSVDVQTDTSNQCTGDTYLKLVPDRSVITTEELQKRVHRIVNERYDIQSFIEFGTAVKRVVTDAETRVKGPDARDAKIASSLRDMMSNRLVIIDEVHNLKVAGDEGETAAKQVSPLLELALKHGQGCKLLLMTATPMFDRAPEIVWILNLLRLNAKLPLLRMRDLFDKNDMLTSAGRKQLETAVRGHVSYMRGSNPWTFPMRLYPSANNDPRVLRPSHAPTHDIHGVLIPPQKVRSDLCLVKSDMGPYQQQVYAQVLAKTLKSRRAAVALTADADDGSSGSSALSSLIEAANIAFPSPSVGSIAIGAAGLGACFTLSKSKTYSYTPAVLKASGEFMDESHLGKYSAKMQAVVQYAKKGEGVTYVYSRFKSSGIIPLALALEHAGFRRFGAPNLLAGGTRARPVVVGGRPACYTILSGDTILSPHMDRDVTAARSAANRDGGVIKVVLCTHVGAEGLDFKCVREVHILEPWFNMKRVEQIIGRGARQCSHISLPWPKRNVTIYHHIATQSRSDAAETIDYRAYRLAQSKESAIAEVEAVLRSNAVDCVLNDAAVEDADYRVDVETAQHVVLKNTRIGGGASASASSSCACALPKGKGRASLGSDASTFDLSQLLDDIGPYVQLISKRFKDTIHHTFESLVSAAPKKTYDATLFLVALQSMLSERTVVVGPAGHRGYIIYAGGEYVWQPLETFDPKLTLSERVKGGKRSSELHLVVRPPPPAPPPTHLLVVEDEHLNRTLPPASPTKSSDAYLVELSHSLNALFTDVHFGQSSAFANTYHRAAIDYLVDRLEPHKLHQIIGSLSVELQKKSMLSRFKMDVLQSLRNSHGLVGSWPRIDYFFDPAGHAFWKVVPSGECFPCTHQQQQHVLSGLQSLEFPETYPAFLEVTPQGRCNFKLWDPRKGDAKGFVCAQTSSLAKNELQSLVTTHHKGIVQVGYTYNKPTLCSVYELILRSMGPTQFARPFQHWWVQNRQKHGPLRKHRAV